MKLKKLFRAISQKEIALDEENRTLEFPFSSEVPVERHFGNEILSHDSKAVKLERLNNSANLLFNHNPDMVIGVVEKAWITPEKRGMAKVRFSKNPKADEVFKDVKDGILRNVSFGYQINEMDLTKKSETGLNDYTATDWMPFEVSVVTIPADYSVGFGRSDEDEEKEVKVNETFNEETKNEEIIMSEQETKIEQPKVNVEAIASEARDAERSRIAEVSALGEKFGHKDLARQLIEGGKSIDVARAAFLEKMTEQKQVPVTGTEGDIGLKDKEIKEFSFVKALNAMANPNDRRAQEAAKFEREVSEAASKKLGKECRGFYVPNEVLRFKRDLSVGTASAGGNLVGTQYLSGSFIDLLRNKMILNAAGITVLSGLTQNVTIGKQTGGATAYMVGEGSAPTESQLTVGQVGLSAKTLAAFTDFSRKLLIQGSPDVEMLVKNDLTMAAGLKLDALGLYGLGSSNEPTGVKATSGINSVNFGADAPTWPDIVQMETEVAVDNADVAAMKYLVNARGRGVLKTALKDTSTANFIWEKDNTVNGYAALTSNQIATPSGSAHDYWFGNWSDLVLGLFGGLDLLADPYSGSSTGTIRVTAFQEIDFAVRNPVSFCYGNNTAL